MEKMSHVFQPKPVRTTSARVNPVSVTSILAEQRSRTLGLLTCLRRTRPVATAAIQGVLCDLDGVIYTYGSPSALPGAAETYKYFRERQIPWLFVTNTNTKTREGLAARLREMGIAVSADDIVSPAKLAAEWLRAHNNGPTALFVAPDLAPEFEGIPLLPEEAESGAAAVVIGDMGLDWSYSTLNRAFRLVIEGELRKEGAVRVPPPPSPPLAPASASTSEASHGGNGSATAFDHHQPQKPQQQHEQRQDGVVTGAQVGSVTAGAASSTNGGVGSGGANGGGDGGAAVCPLALISLGKGRYYKDTDGYSLDVGPFTSALEYATDCKAMVLGKPDPLIFRLAARSMGLKPEQVIMIGDDVRGDVGGAQAAGLSGVLVRTGKFREHDLHVGITPDAVLPSIAELPAWWEEQQQQQHQQDDDMNERERESAAAAAGQGIGLGSWSSS